ncbi:putative polysaccharide biosynthesis protein [Planococcus lenghuensis]|uniref:Polysaccharide biosynthesis/transport protein n=1 Tax=Planococcus lenghuensis TaxID=2213202 RepID=A0A1Q2L1A0_9BACL|nr:polysaccharide biosynthesis protein [Planococcus lenghuensis]AQQ54245.1 polysaccharide biosynthesis/transport protein [Planococcus lenghuensis]
MNNALIRGTLVLSIAALLSKVLGSLFRIPLQNIAGDEVLGIFTLVYPVYMVALTLSVAGIPIAISKLIAESRAQDKPDEVGKIFHTSGILALVFGALFFALIFIFSEQIAAVIGGQATRPALIVVGCTLLVAPYMAVYRGFFQGHGDMTPTAVSQVIEQFIRVGLILVIAVYMVSQLYSAREIAGGIMISSVIGAAASLMYLRYLYSRSDFRVKKNANRIRGQFTRTGKMILAISIPISIGSITMALLNLVDSVTIPNALRVFGNSDDDVIYLYGIYGRGLALVQIVSVFATSVVLPLIPSVSAKLAAGDALGVKRDLEHTYFLGYLISLPAAIGLTVLTLPVNLALFTNLEGSAVLAVIAFSSLFTSMTVLGTGILQGINRAKLAAWIIVGGVTVKALLNLLFIQWYGLLGAAISTTAVYLLLFLVNTYFIWKHTKFNFLSKKAVAGIIAALVMGGIVWLPLVFFEVAEWTRGIAFLYLTASASAGAVIYGSLLLMLNVIDKRLLNKIPVIRSFIK